MQPWHMFPRLGENRAISEYNTGDFRTYNGSLAVAVAITGTVATDGDAANENSNTIDGFSSSAPVIATATARLPSGEVSGGGNEGVGGRLEATLFQAMFGIRRRHSRMVPIPARTGKHTLAYCCY